MNKFLPLVIIMLCISSLPAQTGSITGRVTAPADTLQLATVSLLKTTLGASTDSTGRFEIKEVPAGVYQLRVTYIGYENYQQEVTVAAGQATHLAISMVPLTARLNEVVISGSMKEVLKLESVTPVDVYTYRYLQRNPTTNLFEALQGMGGLFADVDNGVANTTDVQINGLEGNYTMYLIDGVPALNGLAGVYALNAFPTSVIDRVEVVKGASSALYGSDAIGGVVNIKTKNPATLPKLSINAGLTSMLEANADFAVRYKLGKANCMLAGGGESFNYRWDLNNDGFLDIPLVNRANFLSKWSVTDKRNKQSNFYFRYLYEDRFGGDKTVPSQWRGTSRFYTEAITTQQWQMGFNCQLPVRENIQWMVDYSEHRQTANFGFNNYQGTQVSGFTQLVWNKSFDRYSDLVVGAAYRLLYLQDNSPLSQDTFGGSNSPVVSTPALFIQDEITVAQRHKLLFGVRGEYNNRTGFMAMPRISYKWNTRDKNNIVRAGAGTGYRIPNLMNEGFGAMNGSRTIVIEEELKPESVITGNINYTRIQKFKGALLNIDASVFYTYFFNFIDPDYDTDSSAIIYSNSMNGTTAAGFTINADVTFNFPLKVGGNITFSKTLEVTTEEDGEKEIETPPHQPPFVLNFYLSYSFPAPQLTIDWTGNLVSPMDLTTVPNDYRPGKSPWYTIQNIQLRKAFKNGLEVYFGLKNFFNFIQKDPILRPFDPYNRNVTVDNPYNYRFDTTYGFTSTQGIKAFAGLRYVIP